MAGNATPATNLEKQPSATEDQEWLWALFGRLQTVQESVGLQSAYEALAFCLAIAEQKLRGALVQAPRRRRKVKHLPPYTWTKQGHEWFPVTPLPPVTVPQSNPQHTQQTTASPLEDKYRQEAVTRSIQGINDSDNRSTVLRMLDLFKELTGLDSFELMVESRKSQDPTKIEKALDDFEAACLKRNLSSASAHQYASIVRSHFKRNRIWLPRKKKVPVTQPVQVQAPEPEVTPPSLGQ